MEIVVSENHVNAQIGYIKSYFFYQLFSAKIYRKIEPIVVELFIFLTILTYINSEIKMPKTLLNF